MSEWAELGLFRPDERVQLLDGEIVTMTPQNSPHAAAIGKTERVLARVFGDAYWIRIQMPIVLDPDSEPEPDVAVVSGTPADYVQEHPRTAELIVEVSDSTLALDRERKALFYARVGIPEYWIVNLPDRCLEVHREPVASSSACPALPCPSPIGPFRLYCHAGQARLLSPHRRPSSVIRNAGSAVPASSLLGYHFLSAWSNRHHLADKRLLW